MEKQQKMEQYDKQRTNVYFSEGGYPHGGYGC